MSSAVTTPRRYDTFASAGDVMPLGRLAPPPRSGQRERAGGLTARADLSTSGSSRGDGARVKDVKAKLADRPSSLRSYMSKTSILE